MGPRRRGGLWAATLLFSGLLLRLSSWRSIFRGGEVFFVDTDDFYHLRRIMAAAANFPSLPTFDYYLGYPAGFHCNWPPLYDWAVAFLTLLIGLGAPTLELSQIVAAMTPPIAGTLALAFFYGIAREVLPPRGALAALAFAAVLPMSVFYTMLGRPDHHCFEILWVLAVWLSVLRLLRAEDRRERRRWAMAAAAASLLGLMSWVGTFFFSVVLFVFMALELLRPARSGEKPPESRGWFPAVFLLPVPFLILSGAGNRWYAEGRIVFDAPSPFQPLLLTALGLWCLGLGLRSSRGWTAAGVLACAGALAVTGFLLARSMASLAEFAALPPPMFQAASEMRPFLKPHGRWSLENVRAYFGAAFWLLPFLAGLFAVEERSPRRRLILAWTLMTGLLMLWQTRYAFHFSFPAALLLGCGVHRLWEKLEALPEFGFRGGRAWTGGAVVFLSAGLLFSALKNVASLSMTDAENLTDSADLLAACRWLRRNTPPTRSLWKDEGPPEYGVYALHSIGNQIAAIAQRPAAAGNMHALRQALTDSVAFFFLEDPAAAYHFLGRRGFRYLLLSDLVHDGRLSLYARMYGLYGYQTAPKPDGSLDIPSRVWDLIYMRLFVLDGSSAPAGAAPPAALDRFRLVYESSVEKHGSSLFKVFELVAGARLRGRCAPGSRVKAETPVRTQRGREFLFRNSSACGQAGVYEMTLPYAGFYDVRQGALRRRGEAREEQVLKGGLLKLDMQEPSRQPEYFLE